MNPTGGSDDLFVRTRSVLLGALVALVAHRDSVVVIGAQAVYLHTGSAPAEPWGLRLRLSTTP